MWHPSPCLVESLLHRAEPSSVNGSRCEALALLSLSFGLSFAALLCTVSIFLPADCALQAWRFPYSLAVARRIAATPTSHIAPAPGRAVAVASARYPTQGETLWGGVREDAIERFIPEDWDKHPEERDKHKFRDNSHTQGYERYLREVESQKPVPQRQLGLLGMGGQPLVGELSELTDASSFGTQMPRMLYRIGGQREDSEWLARSAAAAGFRGFDTSSQNEDFYEPGVGAALASLFASGVPRESVFIQTKVEVTSSYSEEWQDHVPLKEQVNKSIANSLANFGVEYIDSLLLFAPWMKHDEVMEAWSAMEDQVRSGSVRQLGIFNANTLHNVKKIYYSATLKPAVVQLRVSPDVLLNFEREMSDWCSVEGAEMYLQQAAILGANRRLPTSKQLQLIAQRHKVLMSTVYLRFVMGLGVVPLISSHEDGELAEARAAFKVALPLEASALMETIRRDELRS